MCLLPVGHKIQESSETIASAGATRQVCVLPFIRIDRILLKQTEPLHMATHHGGSALLVPQFDGAELV